MPGPKSVHVRIEGRVQGVWYRAWTLEEAGKLGLSGWVRNRHDGAVEAVFSGDEASVDRMLKLCQDGPPLASVSAVIEDPCEPPEPGFKTKSTA